MTDEGFGASGFWMATWKEEKGVCMKEITSLLTQISSVDRSLVWECMDMLEEYDKGYEYRHRRSLFVATNDGGDMYMDLVA